MLLDVDYALRKPRMRNEMNMKMIWHIRQCIGHETSVHGLWTKLEEMYQEKTSQNKALIRRLVLKLQRGTTGEDLTSEFQRKCQRRDQRRGLKKEEGPEELSKEQSTRSVYRGRTTTMIDVDESDVLLAASADEEVVGKGTVLFRMADGRSMKVIGVRHISLRCKIRSDEAFEASGGTLGVSKRNRKCCRIRKTRGLYRLEGSVQTRGVAIRHGSSEGLRVRGLLVWGECYGASESTESTKRSDKEMARIVRL
ncbi:hypothetical protein Acr_09g0004700 [Actinidia rufa]|uniref:Uncharacterized protein n=1 Tax=Actinidia rufa TaxID=165716 RepID=A0A7J0F5P8_9ERIC|nr:hypothetical protein Acr_09g0004700 [Actinidia rufa]